MLINILVVVYKGLQAVKLLLIFGNSEEKVYEHTLEVQRASATETTTAVDLVLIINGHNLLNLPQRIHGQQTVCIGDIRLEELERCVRIKNLVQIEQVVLKIL